MHNPWKSSSKVNPQTEKGTRRIATDLWLALTMIDITGTEQKVLMAVIHCTWGFRKLDSQISFGMLSMITGKSRSSVIRSVKKLVAQRILLYEHEVVYGKTPLNRYQLNKYWDTWIDKSGSVLVTTSQNKWLRRFSQGSSVRDFKVVYQPTPNILKDIKKEKEARKLLISETEIDAKGKEILKKLGIKPSFDILGKPDKKKTIDIDKKDLEF